MANDEAFVTDDMQGECLTSVSEIIHFTKLKLGQDKSKLAHFRSKDNVWVTNDGLLTYMCEPRDVESGAERTRDVEIHIRLEQIDKAERSFNTEGTECLEIMTKVDIESAGGHPLGRKFYFLFRNASEQADLFANALDKVGIDTNAYSSDETSPRSPMEVPEAESSLESESEPSQKSDSIAKSRRKIEFSDEVEAYSYATFSPLGSVSNEAAEEQIFDHHPISQKRMKPLRPTKEAEGEHSGWQICERPSKPFDEKRNDFRELWALIGDKVERNLHEGYVQAALEEERIYKKISQRVALEIKKIVLPSKKMIPDLAKRIKAIDDTYNAVTKTIEDARAACDAVVESMTACVDQERKSMRTIDANAIPFPDVEGDDSPLSDDISL